MSTPQPILFEKKFLTSSRSASTSDGTSVASDWLISSARMSARSIQSQSSRKKHVCKNQQVTNRTLQGNIQSNSTKNQFLQMKEVPQRLFVTNGSNVFVESADPRKSSINSQVHILKAFDESRQGNAFAAIQRQGRSISSKKILNEKLHQFKISRSLERENPDKYSELLSLYKKLSESLNDDAGGIKEVVPIRFRREKFKVMASNAEKIKPLKAESREKLNLEDTYLMHPKRRLELLKQQIHQQQSRIHVRKQIAKQTRMERYIQQMYKNGSLLDFQDVHTEDQHAAHRKDLAAKRFELLENKQHSSEGRLTFGKEFPQQEQKIFPRKKVAEFSSNANESLPPKQRMINPYRRERLFAQINANKKFNIITGEELQLK